MRVLRIAAIILAFAVLSRQGSAEDARSLSALMQEGIACTRSGELEKAAALFRKALELKPDFLPARKNLATVLWFLNRKQESEREFLSLVKLLPNDPAPHLYLGLAAYDRKQYAVVTKHLEMAGALAMDNPEILPVLAEAYDKQGLPEKAYSAYTKLIGVAPDAEQNYIAFAGFASAHRNNAFALGVVDRGLARKPESAKLLLKRGILLALEGDVAQAEISFQKASEKDPGWSLPLLALGIGQLEQSRFSEAIATFRQATEKAPGDDRAQYLLATALKRAGVENNSKAREEMVAALRKAIQLNPSATRARIALAQSYLAADHPDAAISELEKATAIDPRDSNALYQLGLAYQRRGQADKARQLFQAFQDAKSKSQEEENELVQILKTVKVN